MTRGVSRPSQTSKMNLLTKILPNFQPLTIFARSFFHLRCFNTLLALSCKKTDILFSYTSYLYQHSIDFQINMAGKNYKWTQKYENVNIFIKCALQYIYNMLQYEICSPSPSSKTAQRNSQNCTKLHNKVHDYGGPSKPSSFCKRFLFLKRTSFSHSI